MATAAAMDAIFKALADPSRRQLLDRLDARGGQTPRSTGTRASTSG